MADQDLLSLVGPVDVEQASSVRIQTMLMPNGVILPIVTTDGDGTVGGWEAWVLVIATVCTVAFCVWMIWSGLSEKVL